MPVCMQATAPHLVRGDSAANPHGNFHAGAGALGRQLHAGDRPACRVMWGAQGQVLVSMEPFAGNMAKCSGQLLGSRGCARHQPPPSASAPSAMRQRAGARPAEAQPRAGARRRGAAAVRAGPGARSLLRPAAGGRAGHGAGGPGRRSARCGMRQRLVAWQGCNGTSCPLERIRTAAASCAPSTKVRKGQCWPLGMPRAWPSAAVLSAVHRVVVPTIL